MSPTYIRASARAESARNTFRSPDLRASFCELHHRAAVSPCREGPRFLSCSGAASGCSVHGCFRQRLELAQRGRLLGSRALSLPAGHGGSAAARDRESAQTLLETQVEGRSHADRHNGQNSSAEMARVQRRQGPRLPLQRSLGHARRPRRWVRPVHSACAPAPGLRKPDRTPPLSCTNWTRLVLLPVLTGHVSSRSCSGNQTGPRSREHRPPPSSHPAAGPARAAPAQAGVKDAACPISTG